jgi:carotenoid cleavage dioxygenase-like enzyme
MEAEVLPPYRANLAAIDFETLIDWLPVVSEMPAELHGGLVRNGPNPLHADAAQHWFVGHGIVHRLTIADWSREVRDPLDTHAALRQWLEQRFRGSKRLTQA